MLASTILYIFVFLIFLAIFIEYRNDQKYQAKRREERQKTSPKKPTELKKEIPEEEKIPQEEPEPQVEEKPEIEKVPEEVEEIQPEAVEEVEPEVILEEVIEEVQPEVIVEVEPEEEPEPEEVIEEVEEAKELPTCEYPPFTHVRLVEMGLSDDEAIEFVNELIPQLEEQVPLIENAINSADFHQIEKLTHGIKGSATNLGTGGVSDLLVEFNTYIKSDPDADIVKAYHAHFIHYIEELKKQYT
jgi:HPt (histidine-containing phosphotransfer) domain-containing protein